RPAGPQLAVAWGETLCGLLPLVGLMSRLAAVGLAAIQVGAIMVQTRQFDFIHIEYIKHNPARAPTGSEYNFALIIMCLAVVVLGSGLLSLDCLLKNYYRRRKARQPSPQA